MGVGPLISDAGLSAVPGEQSCHTVLVSRVILRVGRRQESGKEKHYQ